jgi:methyl-accepting chemotaxis protein
MNIRPRLYSSFAALIVLSVAVVSISIQRLSSLADSVIVIDKDRVPKVQQLADLTDSVNQIARDQRDMLIWDDAAKNAATLATIAKTREHVNEVLTDMERHITSEEGRKRLAALQAARATYMPNQLAFNELITGGKRDLARTLLQDKLGPAQASYMEAIDKLKDLQIQLVGQAAREGEASFQTTLILLLALLGAMTTLGGVLAWRLARSITVPLDAAVAVAERVTVGDLTVQIDTRANDETGRLMKSLQTMTSSLTTIVSQVRASSESIATGSAQIATGNTDLSQRTETQASSLQQTAASMEELSGTVKNSAASARQANQLAVAASAAATHGGELVDVVVGTMGEISTASRKISEIIGVIDGIAFQTNILALNAAVEAARAGEQGRGFAVVASEVRSLAQRSAAAAREIKTLIGASVDRVEAGSRQVAEAGHTMTEIVGSVQRVSDIISEISLAAAEQSNGIGQVNGAVADLDRMTQQNAALVEQSTAAAESLKDQATRLSSLVDTFRLQGAQT